MQEDTLPAIGIAYTDLSWPQRKMIMDAIEQAGSQLYEGHKGTGFSVAIGKTKFAHTCEVMRNLGFICFDLYEFPLGSDQPPEHLRHGGNWLIAQFKPLEVASEAM